MILSEDALMRENDGPLTMRDIARLAGVSESTVSRALSDSPLVAKATRLKIQEIAQNNHYILNEQARNLRQRRTRTVEVVIPVADSSGRTISDPFYLDLLGQLATNLSDRGYDLLLSTRLPWVSGRRNSVEAGRSDGIILIGQGRAHEEIRTFTGRGIPVVVWGGNFPEDNYALVGCDNLKGGRLATEHLIKVGRKHLAFCGDRRHGETAQRYEGACQVMLEHDLELIDVIVPNFAPDALSSLRTFLTSNDQIDGLFCASDVIASAALTVLADMGRSVGRDVNVVGFDDVTAAATMSPPLTTISQDIVGGARALVDQILHLIDGGEPERVTQEPRLIIRKT